MLFFLDETYFIAGVIVADLEWNIWTLLGADQEIEVLLLSVALATTAVNKLREKNSI